MGRARRAGMSSNSRWREDRQPYKKQENITQTMVQYIVAMYCAVIEQVMDDKQINRVFEDARNLWDVTGKPYDQQLRTLASRDEYLKRFMNENIFL
jgi:hypothetical protein